MSRAASQSLTELIEPVCSAHGMELVQVRLVSENGRNILRALIDRDLGGDVAPGTATDGSGVTLKDCTRISRDLSTVLDVHEELLPAKYSLEVSSPGLERPLTKVEHFTRFTGHEVAVDLSAPVDGRRRFKGEILGVDGDQIHLSQDGTKVTIPFGDITKGHLVYRF